MILREKTILILSPQSWGKMVLSKQHYAIELANRGNRVYFLNPPEVNNARVKAVDMDPSGIKNLFIIRHKINFPYRIKFHAIRLFHFFMQFHIRKILRTIEHPIDIIWSFDLGNLYPFRFFTGVNIKIFHPVDEPLNQTAIDAEAGCTIIFSVTKEILEKYSFSQAPRFFINHGLSSEFLQKKSKSEQTGGALQAGFSGNLTRNDIDHQILLQIVKENSAIHFHFWGSYHITQSNISGTNDPVIAAFIKNLQENQNVSLHGPVGTSELAAAIQEMDLFLICYDVQKDQSKGTNYHKIMEYLSTGKVIISNNVTTYSKEPGLVQMVKERNNNHNLPGLFREIISNLASYNTPALQQQRRAFAEDNLYSKQLDRIESILSAPPQSTQPAGKSSLIEA
ncbi:MAG TPA: hypothetical protein VM012_04025 [Flavitalea sp.]|nr:hypothetical protein [Flavitalea sp.]